MKILFLPLDERPCNYVFPQMMENEKLELVTCEKDILGDKKKAGNTEKIGQFLLDHSSECDCAVLSLDTLLYGGLLPSRLHYETTDTLSKRLTVVKKMKEVNPKLKIYAFQCIMRCPQYNSGEEEPDYYEEYGLSVFRNEYLKDKKERDGLSEEEEKELNSLSVPEEIIKDYADRRKVNISMNQEALSLVKDGTIDFYVIPQDDSSPYGYTAEDQKKVLSAIAEEQLEMKTMVYPGADEVGMSLITRAYNEFYELKPKIYPYYASVLGPTIIPKYEDRPMYESLKSHIRVTGARICRNVEEADYVLAINCPGKVMQEAFDEKKDVSYSSFRELLSFAERIQEDCEECRKVIICDSAYSNGGDLQLLKYLDEMKVLDRIYAYGGWNTNCNTLGTVLSVAETAQSVPVHNIIYRVIEDCFYQAEIRMRVVQNDLPEMGLGYYDFKDRQSEVERRIGEYLLKEYNTLHLSHKYPIASLHVNMPWCRMFEIGMEIDWE